MENQTGDETRSVKRPYDFAFRYESRTGTNSSPDYVEFVVEIAPDGSGEIRYMDSDHYKTDEFVDLFYPSEEALERLYRMMLAFGIFEQVWQPPRAGQKNGENMVKLEITCAGNFFEAPASQREADTEPLIPVFEAIRGLVPQTTWDKIRS